MSAEHLDAPESKQQQQLRATNHQPISKLPSVYLNHGGGASFFMPADRGDFIYGAHSTSEYAEWLRSFSQTVLKGVMPKAIVIFSGHWETEDAIAINMRENHTRLFDFGGFPSHTYQQQYPAKGDPVLGQRIASLLQSAGFKTREEHKRGLDHGMFNPLKLMYPEANIPIVPVSLLSSLDPATHMRIGAALEPLRAEGVLIFGSGSLTHGFRATLAQVKSFVSWANHTVCSQDYSADERRLALLDASRVTGFHELHPTTDHLIPLYIAAGANGFGPGTKLCEGSFGMGKFDLTGYRFD